MCSELASNISLIILYVQGEIDSSGSLYRNYLASCSAHSTSDSVQELQMQEVAERVLMADSLEEKLLLAPQLGQGVVDDQRGRSYRVPDTPGRPEELKITDKAVRSHFPGVNKLDDDRERGRMLHFLANHEMLAAELMALVLLKFPDAPAEYRRGVYESMREEQMHTLMYLRRMKECGIAFGDLPLNDYFWKLVSPMQTPMDFVTRLNLTFEQANLDFSKHYATLFRQVGDNGTATVLEKIYLDEINHVGHGLKWFRKWKKNGETDWDAYRKSLTFPMAPAKAKGMAPYNAKGRELAGLNQDFIERLAVCEQSRGRTPVVHWYNPNAESHAAASFNGHSYQPNKIELAMEHDLEMLTMAWSRKDDVALMRTAPSNAHLAYLKNAGFDLPEIMGAGCLAGRKLGGLRPWAWSPDASAELCGLAGDISPKLPWQWQGDVPQWWFSKEAGCRLSELLSTMDGVDSFFFKDIDSATVKIDALLKEGNVLLKAAYACAGRGHRRVEKGDDYLPWLRNVIRRHGGVAVEPWLNRVLDFSALYERREDGRVDFIGMTEMQNDAQGRYLSTKVYPKWGTGLSDELSSFMFRDAQINDFYGEKIPMELSSLLQGYVGPVGVDAMVHRCADGSLAMRYVVELNVRMTMGRVALEIAKKRMPLKGGELRVLRKNKLAEGELCRIYNQVINNSPVVINDPERAREFVAVWVQQD
jgi:uncharacterized ferritin-like protein (DUF455 family)